MIIKNAKKYRDWYKLNIRKTKDENRNTNFIGSYNEVNDTFGFFDIYHGDKKDIKNFLISTLQNAEDEQAIYEFIQNASDCGSSDFILIYDESNFLVINNGEPFHDDNIRSILNVDQSTKFERQGDSYTSVIGKYGLGFKLAHRLVGKDEGADELLGEKKGEYTNQHKGPVLFSWYNKNQFEELLKCNNENDIVAEKSEYIKNATNIPWLIKIILTCFPTHPLEGDLINLKFNKNQCFFTKEDFDNLIKYVHNNKEFITSINLDKGSLFYLRLGDEVYEKLQKTDDNIKTGIQYSLNLLSNKLKSIYINGSKQIIDFKNNRIEIKPLEKIPFKISKDSEKDLFESINPEYKNEDIEIIFGFPKRENKKEVDFIAEINELKKSANLYQYFPLGGELHNLAFILHSNAFARQSNRKFLEKDVSKNIELFNAFVTKLKADLEILKTKNIDRYKRIFEIILLSDRSTGVHKELINENLYDPLNEYIKTNCPTNEKETFGSKDTIKINCSLLLNQKQFQLNEFGISNKWFAWGYFNNTEICKKAKDKAKTNIKVWYLGDVINELKNENIEDFNNWIEKLNDKDYFQFLKELNEIGNRDFEEEREKGDELSLTEITVLSKIKFIKLKDKDERIYYTSIEGINEDKSIILTHLYTKKLSDIFRQVGLKVSVFSTSDFRISKRNQNEEAPKSNIEVFLHDKINHLKYYYYSNDDSYFT